MCYFETARNKTGHLDSHLNTVIITTIIMIVITLLIRCCPLYLQALNTAVL